MGKFKIGTIVQLKSGSHAMTSGADDPKNKLKVICTWAVNGMIKEKSFFKDQLEIVESENIEYLNDIIKTIKG